jgi:hypothetical protein
VVAGCQSYLQRFTWRHDSILNFLPETFQTINPCQLYADLSGYKSLSIITGDIYRPDLLLITPNEDLYVVELTVLFESNLHNNVECKKAKYKDLIEDQRGHFNSVKFVSTRVPPITSSGYHIIPITRACNVFKECGPMITGILRKCLQFNTLLIFIPTYIPSNKLSEF